MKIVLPPQPVPCAEDHLNCDWPEGCRFVCHHGIQTRAVVVSLATSRTTTQGFLFWILDVFLNS